MSGYITNAGENYLLDLLTGRAAHLPRYYLALVVSKQPSKFISGAELDEPLAGEYERVVYPNEDAYWTASAGEIHNTVGMAFPEAVTDWGTVKYWAMCDSPESGDVLWAGAFTLPLVVMAGDRVDLDPGTMTLRVTSYTARVSL
jgi:hypothetical protein